MRVIEPSDLERLVRKTFPEKPRFCADAELGLTGHARPLVTFVHGGRGPNLDDQFDAWLDGSARFVAVYALLNGLCRAGALVPGNYAVRPRPS